MPFVAEMVPEIDVDGRVRHGRPARPGLLDLDLDRRRAPRARRGRRSPGARRQRQRGLSVRIDVVSIFPDYLAPLRPVAGRQGRRGRHARPARARPARPHPRPAPHRRRHALRRRPGHGDEARALGRGARRAARWRAPARDRPRLVVPTPSGRRFTQDVAAEYAADDWLVFACGRYEGIDSRVAEHYADRMRGRRGERRRLRPRRAARPPCSSWSRRTARLLPGRARQPRQRASTTPSPRGRWSRCSRARSSPSRRSGGASTCRRCCSPATTAGSPPGAASRPEHRTRAAPPRPARPAC